MPESPNTEFAVLGLDDLAASLRGMGFTIHDGDADEVLAAIDAGFASRGTFPVVVTTAAATAMMKTVLKGKMRAEQFTLMVLGDGDLGIDGAIALGERTTLNTVFEHAFYDPAPQDREFIAPAPAAAAPAAPPRRQLPSALPAPVEPAPVPTPSAPAPASSLFDQMRAPVTENVGPPALPAPISVPAPEPSPVAPPALPSLPPVVAPAPEPTPAPPVAPAPAPISVPAPEPVAPAPEPSPAPPVAPSFQAPSFQAPVHQGPETIDYVVGQQESFQRIFDALVRIGWPASESLAATATQMTNSETNMAPVEGPPGSGRKLFLNGSRPAPAPTPVAPRTNTVSMPGPSFGDDRNQMTERHAASLGGASSAPQTHGSISDTELDQMYSSGNEEAEAAGEAFGLNNRRRNGDIIFVVSGKGGVMKTTCSILLAKAASEARKHDGSPVFPRVLLVDGTRNQGSIHTLLRFRKNEDGSPRFEKTIRDLGKNRRVTDTVLSPGELDRLRPDQLVNETMSSTKFSVILAPPPEYGNENDTPASYYSQALTWAKENFDLIIVDTQILSSDPTDLFVDCFAPFIRAGGWALGVSETLPDSLKSTTTALDWLRRETGQADRILLAATLTPGQMPEREQNTFRKTFYDGSGIPPENFVGSLARDAAVAIQMARGSMPVMAPSVAPALSAVLYRVTGREEFNIDPNSTVAVGTSTADTVSGSGRRFGGLFGRRKK